MRPLWRLRHATRLPSPGMRQRYASSQPARQQHLRLPTPWVGCWLVLLLCLSGEVSTVLGAELPRPARRSPLPQTFAPSPPPGVGREPAPTGPVAGVSLQENRLSVDVRDQDLRAILETIATQGGIEVRHAEGLSNTRVSVRFAALPVLDGLKRLLRAADVMSYALITETVGEHVQVRRILFLPAPETASSVRPGLPTRRPLPGATPVGPATDPSPVPAAPPQVESDRRDEASGGGSVFDDIKNNTAARRLLSQLVHPNEQVRERALERLVQLVSDDQKQAELLETLEPLMENLGSDDKATRDEARTEIRKLLNR